MNITDSAISADRVSDEGERGFREDLEAALRFKVFLLGNGVEVPNDTLTALNGLAAKYLSVDSSPTGQAEPLPPPSAPQAAL